MHRDEGREQPISRRTRWLGVVDPRAHFFRKASEDLMGAMAQGKFGVSAPEPTREWLRSGRIPFFLRPVAFQVYRGGGNPRRRRQLCRPAWRGRSPLGAPRQRSGGLAVLAEGVPIDRK